MKRLAPRRLCPESRTARLSCVALSAGLLAVPVHCEPAWPVGAVFLVPALVACRRAPPIEAVLLGALLGILYGIAISLWIPAALQGLGSSPLASLAGLVAVSLWSGPPVFGWIGLLSRWTDSWSPALRAIALAAGVFGVEQLVSHVWWGVPWGLLGTSQRGVLGVAQLAVAGGVPLVSAGLVAINALVADVCRGEQRALRAAAASVAGWVALALVGLPVAESVRPAAADSTGMEILFVQPNLPRGERWGRDLQPLNLYRVQVFMRRVLAEEPPGVDAWVLPENLLTTPLDASPELGSAVKAWVDELVVPVLSGLVLSARSPDRGRYRSSVVWLEPGRGITARLDKEHAIPLLESSRRFPGDALLVRLFGEAAQWPKVEESGGSGPLRGPISVTPVLCYEVLFPGIVAKRRTPDSVAIVNLADDSWVEGESATRHLTHLARFRAIEQRLPLIRLAHGGLSAVVDEWGRVTKELPLHTYASMRLSLHPMPPPTFFERAAILALPAVAASVVWWGWVWLPRRQPRITGEER